MLRKLIFAIQDSCVVESSSLEVRSWIDRNDVGKGRSEQKNRIERVDRGQFLIPKMWNR